jgi:hypothetical protein
VCYPGSGLGAKEFAERLGLDWDRYRPQRERPRIVIHPRVETPAFTAAEAQAVWEIALARARDDDSVGADAAVYAYVAGRQLLESWELGLFGVLAPSERLHPAVRTWPSRSYQVVAPLHDQHGAVVNLQARAINERAPKTLVPAGSTVAGTVFADRAGRALLRGESGPDSAVIYGEGLTDLLALASSAVVPVLCAPGTSNAARGAGTWARGREILLALDCDAAGDQAVPNVSARLYGAGARNVRRVRWPRDCKDACDVVAQRGVVGLEEFLALLLRGSA